jgi:hypothetical protein
VTLADLTKKTVLEILVVPAEFKKDVAEQSTFYVLVFPTETPSIKGYAVDAIRACTAGLVFARIVLEVSDVELFDCTLSSTPATEKADTERGVVLI